jgi:hypothetical protein
VLNKLSSGPVVGANSAGRQSVRPPAPAPEPNKIDRSRLALRLASAGAALLLMTGATRSLADDNCQQLETLSQQYEGVELTVVQKQMKRRMIMWYNKNCRTHRSAQAN